MTYHTNDIVRIPCRTMAVLLGTVMILPSYAQAQSDAPPARQATLEEVVVTAQRRSENLQSVPISVSAATADTLAMTGITDTTELSQIMPSVQFTRSGPSGLFFVRGVGTTNGAAGEEGANAFYIDGVYQSSLAQTVNNFNNIERVEVLKGPQGTLFGRNATGGLVHIITRDPGDETVVNAKVGYGKFNTYSAQLYAATPLSDSVSADIALSGTDQKQGWGRNKTLNRDVRLGHNWGARSKVVFQPSDRMTFKLAGDWYKADENQHMISRLNDEYPGVGGFISPDGQDTTSNERNQHTLENWGISLTADLDLGFATLSSITAVRDLESIADGFDADGGPLPLVQINYVSGVKSYQQELRLASQDSRVLDWQTGLFFLRTEATNSSRMRGIAFGGADAGPNINASMDTDSYAAFIETTYHFTDNTRLITGLRYTEDSREFDAQVATVSPAGVAGPITTLPTQKLDYEEFTYRLALQHDLTDDMNVYASVNRGFKAGSFSLQSPTAPPVDPQYITAYEIGLKSEFFDRRLRLNIAAYHYDISDYQVRSTAPPAPPGGNLLLNAANVEVDGIDVEFDAAITDRLRLFGAVTWLDSKFSKFPSATFAYPQPAVCHASGTRNPGSTTGPATGGVINCSGDATGNTTPMAPDLTASLGAAYYFPIGENGEIRMTGLYSYNDGYYFESDMFLGQGSFNTFNASIEYRPNSRWGIELWGRNLSNERYDIQGGAAGYTTAGNPRTYGVNLSFDL